ncbi:MAG: twin-arginine translocase TatA/TatE family subunit [Chloroflexota bacterium]
MPFNIGPTELIIILVIALLVLGPGKLPEVGSALGKGIREFRKAASDVKDAASIEPYSAGPAATQPPAPAAPQAPAVPAAGAGAPSDVPPEADAASGTEPGSPAS